MNEPAPAGASQDSPRERLRRWVLATDRNAMLFLALLAAALILPWLGLRDVIANSEGQRTYPPLEMVQTGDWLVPKLNGNIYLKKPPLLYWAVAVSYKALGVGEFQARLPGAICGILFVVSVFRFAREMGSRKQALLAGAIGAANFLLLDKARECQLEAPLVLFVTLALHQWWRALKALESGAQGKAALAVLVGAAWLSLSNLLKFPVPFLFMLSAIIGTAVCMRRWRWLMWAPSWLALVLSIVPVALWAWALTQRLGWELVSSVWLNEAKIHAEKASSLSGGPPWFYVGPALGYFAPWCALYVVLFMKNFWRAQIAEDRLTFHFLWTGVAVPLLLLSLNAAKESDYFISMISLLCILFARAFLFARGYFTMPILGKLTTRTAVVVVLAGYCVAMWIFHPIFEKIDSDGRTPKETAQRTLQIAEREHRPLLYYDMNDPKLYFYMRRIIRNYEENEGEKVVETLRANPRTIVFGEEDTMRQLSKNYPDMQFRELMKTPEKLRQVPYELVASDAGAASH
ncbi:glycosyltransferase family 39 protein [Candidatus Sumerlaeota bacterium]|nr:glycosyltransferase family 39 protein [Candidatus Sumerlaeota bacterium]